MLRCCYGATSAGNGRLECPGSSVRTQRWGDCHLLTVPGLRCCGQRGGFNSGGAGAKGACPGLVPRICDIVAITVAARVFADAAAQRRGQSASDSPRCCGQRGGFNSRGTGAKGACPGLGPRRTQRSLLSRSPRGFLRTPRSNDGDSQQVTVPDAAGSAGASTAGGLAPKVPVPGWGRGGCGERRCHGRRAVFC